MPPAIKEQLRQAQQRIAALESMLFEPATGIDQTDNKESLEESRNRYRKLFNYASDAMFVIDPADANGGCFTDVNNVACKRLGYSREELLRMAPADIIDGSDPHHRRLAGQLIAEGNTTFITSLRQKEGNTLPVEVSTLQLSIAGKECYMAIARDITERKRTEQALQQSENLYRLLADNVHDVIWTTDENLTPQYVSPSFSQLTGYLQQNGPAIIYSEIITSSPSIGDNRFERNTRLPRHWESEISTADGKKIWVESIASLLPESSDRFAGIIGVTRDITSRKKIMLELEAAKEQAFAANRAKSEFLAKMSHEVRTPMNGVLGMLQLLKLTELSDEQLNYVETAMVSGKSLLTIINDILDYSKIEAGKLQLTPEEFSLRAIISTLIKTFDTSINSLKLQLKAHIAEDVPDLLVADPVRIRQIFSNLIGNAIKFTEQGEICIDIGRLSHPDPAQIRLACSITDTGIGVPEDIGDELFEPFFQIEPGRQPSFKGAGLGLSIVKQLVIEMNGTIQLGRNSQGGTTVSLTLEVCAGRQEPTAVPAVTPTPLLTSPSRRLTALIVEDERINQQILQAILTKLGHRAAIAANGHVALDFLRRERFDVVLMDVQMPELDGLETAKIIRNSLDYRHVRNIPIIALTAYAMTGDRERCLAAGMNGYLAKPVDLKALARLLQKLTGEM